MAEIKGVNHAIRASHLTGKKLLIAAKMHGREEREYFQTVVVPSLSEKISYVGEADFDTKVELLQNATALINPIQWSEPFGLVMLEAMACGTPVITTSRGAAPEIVEHGISGFITDSTADMVEAVERVDELNRDVVRRRAEQFTAEKMVAEYLKVYEKNVPDRPKTKRLNTP